MSQLDTSNHPLLCNCQLVASNNLDIFLVFSMDGRGCSLDLCTVIMLSLFGMFLSSSSFQCLKFSSVVYSHRQDGVDKSIMHKLRLIFGELEMFQFQQWRIHYSIIQVFGFEIIKGCVVQRNYSCTCPIFLCIWERIVRSCNTFMPS